MIGREQEPRGSSVRQVTQLLYKISKGTKQTHIFRIRCLSKKTLASCLYNVISNKGKGKPVENKAQRTMLYVIQIKYLALQS